LREKQVERMIQNMYICVGDKLQRETLEKGINGAERDEVKTCSMNHIKMLMSEKNKKIKKKAALYDLSHPPWYSHNKPTDIVCLETIFHISKPKHHYILNKKLI
jgi:hypothetical protein